MTDVIKKPRLDIKAAALAGLVAGLVFMVMEMALVAATTGSPWGPPRMIAAIVLGEGVLPPPATFDLTVLMAAMAVHFALSIILAVVWAVFAGRLAGWKALLLGAIFGLGVYVVSFYGMTAFFPWFAMARNWIGVVSHLVFGLVLAWAYLRFRRRDRIDGLAG